MGLQRLAWVSAASLLLAGQAHSSPTPDVGLGSAKLTTSQGEATWQCGHAATVQWQPDSKYRTTAPVSLYIVKSTLDGTLDETAGRLNEANTLGEQKAVVHLDCDGLSVRPDSSSVFLVLVTLGHLENRTAVPIGLSSPFYVTRLAVTSPARGVALFPGEPFVMRWSPAVEPGTPGKIELYGRVGGSNNAVLVSVLATSLPSNSSATLVIPDTSHSVVFLRLTVGEYVANSPDYGVVQGLQDMLAGESDAKIMQDSSVPVVWYPVTAQNFSLSGLSLYPLFEDIAAGIKQSIRSLLSNSIVITTNIVTDLSSALENSATVLNAVTGGAFKDIATVALDGVKELAKLFGGIVLSVGQAFTSYFTL